MSAEENKSNRKVLTGIVVSDKMDKTVTVKVERRVQHETYQRYVNRQKTYKAHDEANEYKVGDMVLIEESRPMSKTKRWKVLQRVSA